MLIFLKILKDSLISSEWELSFAVVKKVSKFIKLDKIPLDRMDKKNVVYKIHCKSGKCYIGQSKRPLRIRRKEHIDNTKLNDK